MGLYQRSIDSAVRYETSYTANEHTQYITKSWLSMVAADPLSLVQRQAKECNSHGRLLATAVGAVQELSTRLAALEARLAALE